MKEVINFDMKIPQEVSTIYNIFRENGYGIFLVGGCVRDSLLGISPKDWDLVTEAKPEVVLAILKNAGIKSLPKGISFGVVSAIINGFEFEIATARVESYSDDTRRPTEVQYATLEQDISRRDLTINSLVYDIGKKEVIDFVGGVKDLRENRVKMVGNPIERLSEDNLRLLRILRFSNRFGSIIDKETEQAILKFKELTGVSNERILMEFLSGLKTAKDPIKYLNDYERFGLLPRLFYGVKFTSTFIPGLKNPSLVIAFLLKNNPVENVLVSLSKLTASNELKENVKFLLMFLEKFQNFDALVFSSKLDGVWLAQMKKKYEQLIKKQDTNFLFTKEMLIEWSQINKIQRSIPIAFDRYTPYYSAKDFPDIKPGRELGEIIDEKNAELFLSFITHKPLDKNKYSAYYNSYDLNNN